VSRRFLLVGLTGGLASGKSTVSDILRGLGCVVLDADLLAREVVEPGQPALAAIAREFGPVVLQPDGTLDRKRLGAIVFADPERRRRVEAITHPAIRDRFLARLAGLEARGFEGIVVWDAPVMIESGGHESMDRLVVVVADAVTQRARALARDGDPADVERKIASQMPLAEKARLADYVIDNSGDRAAAAAQVRRVHRALCAERQTAVCLSGVALPLAAMFVVDAEHYGRHRLDPAKAFRRLKKTAPRASWVAFHRRPPSAAFVFRGDPTTNVRDVAATGAHALGLACIVRTFPELVRLEAATPSHAVTTPGGSVVVVRGGKRLRIIAVLCSEDVAHGEQDVGHLSRNVEVLSWVSPRDAICAYARPLRGGSVGQVTTTVLRQIRRKRARAPLMATERAMSVIRDVINGALLT